MAVDWHPMETRPDEGEFLAYDPISGKQDVAYGTTEGIYGNLDVTGTGVAFSTRRGKVGERKSCSATQQDGENGPFDDEFQGSRATHWKPLDTPPKPST